MLLNAAAYRLIRFCSSFDSTKELDAKANKAFGSRRELN